MAEHDGHDPEFAAAAADRSGRLAGFMLACADCLNTVADLRALAAAIPASAIPRRPRDHRLTLEQALRLRRHGLQRLLDAVGASRDVVTRPLALSLTTLGLAGMLLASVPTGPSFTAADQRELAVPLQTMDAPDMGGSGTAMPSTMGDGSATSRAAPDASERVHAGATPLHILSLTCLGLAAAVVVVRRAASIVRGMR